MIDDAAVMTFDPSMTVDVMYLVSVMEGLVEPEDMDMVRKQSADVMLQFLKVQPELRAYRKYAEERLRA